MKALQIMVFGLAMFVAVPLLHGTPFHNGYVYAGIGIGAAWLTAIASILFPAAASVLARRIEDAFIVPAFEKASPYGLGIKFYNLAPLFNAGGLSSSGQKSIVVSVPILNEGRRPTTVLRAVAQRVVAAVKRRAGRWLAHVGKEVCEILPPFTNRYAPPAVSVKALHPGITAPASHVDPRVVPLGARVSVLEVPRGGDIALKAATGSALPAAKFVGHDIGRPTAGTFAAPFARAPRVRSNRNGSQAAESLTGQVNEFWHTSVVRHSRMECKR